MGINLPNKHLSKSQAEMYLRCAKQYEFRYIKGIKEPPNVAMVQGGSAHVALDMNNKHKVVHGVDLPSRTVVERFESEFETSSFEIDRWDDPKELILGETGKLLTNYINQEASMIDPIASETRYEKELVVPDLGVIPVVAIIDIEEKNCLGDYKICGRKKSKNELEGDLQMGLYAWMKEVRNVYFELLIKKKCEVFKQPFCVSDEQIAWSHELIIEVAKGISKGSFPPCLPTEWCCSNAYCGYWHRCRGAKKVIKY
jgi:hypothetical protein